MTPDLIGLLRVLSGAGVRYIVVGGVAAGVHGALRPTLDLDVVYARDPENLAQLAAALAPYRPYLRGAPEGLPFVFDPPTIALKRPGVERTARRLRNWKPCSRSATVIPPTPDRGRMASSAVTARRCGTDASGA